MVSMSVLHFLLNSGLNWVPDALPDLHCMHQATRKPASACTCMHMRDALPHDMHMRDT